MLGLKLALGVNRTPLVSGGGGGGGYVAQAVHFDGTAVLRQASLVLAASPLFSFAYWVKVANGGVNLTPFSFGYSADFAGLGFSYASAYTNVAAYNLDSVHDQSTGFDLVSADASGELVADTQTDVISFNTWMWIAGCFDTNRASNSKLYAMFIGDDSQSFANADDYSSGAFDINFAGDSYIGGTPNMAAFIGDIADLWVAPGQYIDFSVEANRRKFIDAGGKPVDLGADGSIPTGAAPALFFSGGAASFGANKGSAGDVYTLTGSLTNASTSPSDSGGGAFVLQLGGLTLQLGGLNLTLTGT